MPDPRRDRTFEVDLDAPLATQHEQIKRGVTALVERALDEGEAVPDVETGEVVARKILRWVEFPAHLDTGKWKRANGGLEVTVPAECDDPVVTTIYSACLVEMSGAQVGEASIEGGSWRRDPDDPEVIIYKFNLRFAALEGALVLARLAGLAVRDELRGQLRLGIRHQQVGLDLPDGREVDLTARAGEGVDRVDSEGARDVTPTEHDADDD